LIIPLQVICGIIGILLLAFALSIPIAGVYFIQAYRQRNKE